MLTRFERAERGLKRRKAMNLAIAESAAQLAADTLWNEQYQRLVNLAAQIKTCAFNERAITIVDKYGVKVLRHRNERRCRSVLCSGCQHDRARRLRADLIGAVDWISQNHFGTRFLALTLTSANDVDLTRMYQRHDKAMRRFFKNARVSRAFLGTFTAVEVTAAQGDKTTSYHVHSHSICATAPDYFQDPNKYLEFHQLRPIWQAALDVQYAPLLRIQVADQHKGEARNDVVRSFIGECVKYTVKPQSLCSFENGRFHANAHLAAALASGLKGRRLVRHTGLISAALRAARANKRRSAMDGC